MAKTAGRGEDVPWGVTNLSKELTSVAKVIAQSESETITCFPGRRALSALAMYVVAHVWWVWCRSIRSSIGRKSTNHCSCSGPT